MSARRSPIDRFWPELGRRPTPAEIARFERVREQIEDLVESTGRRIEDLIEPIEVAPGEFGWHRRSEDFWEIRNVVDNQNVLAPVFSQEELEALDPEVLLREKLAFMRKTDPSQIKTGDLVLLGKFKEQKRQLLRETFMPSPDDWARAREDFEFFVTKMCRGRLYSHQLKIHHFVEDPEHRDTITLAARGHGKTYGLAYLRPPWKFTYDRDMRFKIISKSRLHAEDIVGAHKKLMGPDGPLGSVICGTPFRDPNRDLMWTRKAYTLPRIKDMLDPSCIAFGVEESVVGTRSDELLLDDVIDRASQRHRGKKTNIEDTYANEIVPLNESDGKETIIGTRKHRTDFYKKRIDTGQYHTLVLPAIMGACEENVHYKTWLDPDNGKRYVEFMVPKNSIEVLCADLWPIDRLLQQRYKIGRLAFLMQYQQNDRFGGGKFDIEDLNAIGPDPFTLDEIRSMHGTVIVSVDPAYTVGEDSDYSAIAVIVILDAYLNGRRYRGAYIIDGCICKLKPLDLELKVRYYIEKWEADHAIVETVGFFANKITGHWAKRTRFGEITFLMNQPKSKDERITEFSKLAEAGLIWVADCPFGDEFSREYGDYTGVGEDEDDHCLDAVEMGTRGRLDWMVQSEDYADLTDEQFARGVC